MTNAMLAIFASISAADAFFAESDNLECFAAQSLALAKEVAA